jgi:hypothetical protein
MRLGLTRAAARCADEVELWKKITGVGSIFVAGVFLNWLASCVPPPKPAFVCPCAPSSPHASSLWHG